MDNGNRYYNCYATAARARNPQFKAFWLRLAGHFYRKISNEN